MYFNLNDYELIYLYRENSEKALNLLFEKYSLLINKIMVEKGIINSKNDSFQDSLIVLYNCINNYDMNSECPFFNYFLVCLKRQIYKNKIKEINYGEMVEYDDQTYMQSNNYYLNEEPIEYELCSKNELEKNVIEEILIENLSPRTFAAKYNLDIKKVYNTIFIVKNKIKKMHK